MSAQIYSPLYNKSLAQTVCPNRAKATLTSPFSDNPFSKSFKVSLILFCSSSIVPLLSIKNTMSIGYLYSFNSWIRRLQLYFFVELSFIIKSFS